MATRYKKAYADSELVERIREAIKWDKRISNADFELQAHGNVVVVSGYVDSSFKKKAALDVISRTEGVWQIEDFIVVPIDFYRPDEEIADILAEQIGELIKVGGEHIDIEVRAGVVKLEGEVFRPRLKAMASARSWDLSGVRDVLNYINIKGPPRQMPLAFDYEIFGLYEQKENRSSGKETYREVS
ncbi:hypothetical protein BDW_13250 [Bdellovibrio bacteriovorus W]|nr:hypothetical protein BDW_13250 [Bdellovibrio bacteriovorus W]